MCKHPGVLIVETDLWGVNINCQVSSECDPTVVNSMCHSQTQSWLVGWRRWGFMGGGGNV